MFNRYFKQWIIGLGIFGSILLPLTDITVGAEKYPSKTIRLIVGYAPGGAGDRHARLVAPFLQKHLGQSVMIENVVGAEGCLGANKVYSSPPDGYTLLVQSNLVLSFQELNFPEIARFKAREFPHISSLIREYILMVSHAEVWKNFDEFSKAAETKRLRVGVPGRGGLSAVYPVMLEQMLALKFNLISYGGGGELSAALAGKHLDAASSSLAAFLPLIRSGTFNGILLFSDRRHPILPQTPVPEELGLKSYENMENLFGVYGPPKISTDRVKVLEEAFAKAVKEPEYLEKTKAMFAETRYLNSRDFLLKTERVFPIIEKYMKFYKEAFK